MKGTRRMAVVINDFEVLPEAAPAARQDAAASGHAGDVPPPPEPRVVQEALRALHEQALRAWAH